MIQWFNSPPYLKPMNLWTVSVSKHFPLSGMTAVSLLTFQISLNTELSNYFPSLGHMKDNGHEKHWVDNAESVSIQCKSNFSKCLFNKAFRNSIVYMKISGTEISEEMKWVQSGASKPLHSQNPKLKLLEKKWYHLLHKSLCSLYGSL